MTYPFILKEEQPVVYLYSEDIKYCQIVAKIREKYEEWTENSYKKGAMNSEQDKFKTERMGLHGERAFSKFLGNFPIDEKYRGKGDNGVDFLLNTNKIDVKFHAEVAQYKRNNFYGGYYIKATFKDGRIKTINDIKTNIYVFTVFDEMINEEGKVITSPVEYKKPGADLDAICIKIRIKGFITKDKIFSNWEERISPTIYKSKSELNAKNFYIKEEELSPISDLVFYYSPYIYPVKSSIFTINSLKKRMCAKGGK